METSRDSSAWRSLAVTFGGGLALGAVGMRLTQTALRPLDLAPRPDPPTPPSSAPAVDRLERMERRLERMEKTAPTAAALPVTAQIDHKVLEAVVGAVDARIHEHAGQVERRIADLEAKLVVELQSLHQEDRTLAGATEQNLLEIQRQVRQEVVDLRTVVGQELRKSAENVSKLTNDRQQDRDLAAVSEKKLLDQSRMELAELRTVVSQEMRTSAESVAKLAAEQANLRVEMGALHEQDGRIIDSAEQRFADLRQEFRQELAAIRTSVEAEMAAEINRRTNSLERSLETRIVTAAAAAVAGKFEQELAPLRTEVAQKEKELSELRERLAESERAVVDMIMSIGDVCRQAADRIGATPDSRPPTLAVAPDPAPVSAQAEPTAETAPVAPAGEPTPEIGAKAEASEPAALAPVEVMPQPRPFASQSVVQSVPEFLHDGTNNRNWRVPLVSTFLLVVSTGILLVHYL